MENDNQNTANEIMDKKFLEKVKRQFDRLTEVEKEKLRVSISWFFLNDSIKRKIIGNSIIRPSNMANKLLLKGINYINEFKNLKEEESKKKY